MEKMRDIDRLGVAIADHVRDTKSRWSDELSNSWNAAADEHRNMLLRITELEEGIRQHLTHHENGCTYLSHLVTPNVKYTPK